MAANFNLPSTYNSIPSHSFIIMIVLLSLVLLSCAGRVIQNRPVSWLLCFPVNACNFYLVTVIFFLFLFLCRNELDYVVKRNTPEERTQISARRL